MGYERVNHNTMTLFAGSGERKYLSEAERRAFYDALDVLGCAKERAFCEMIYWTGCRPSEALNLTVRDINVEEGTVIIRTLKKRGKDKGRHFRSIPLPRHFVERLEGIYKLRALQNSGNAQAALSPLWTFSRTTGWSRMAKVMQAAKISGIRACARGLRHSFGVHAALTKIPETRIKKWLGHTSLATTEIYMNTAGAEDRAIAARMWEQRPQSVSGTVTSLSPDEASSAEIIRLVCAYSSIKSSRPRMAFLNGLEAHAETNFSQ